MDDLLVIELMFDNFEFVFPFPFAVLSCVIKNNYMHSFMQRVGYRNIFLARYATTKPSREKLPFSNF
jgi:hypothetical protein